MAHCNSSSQDAKEQTTPSGKEQQDEKTGSKIVDDHTNSISADEPIVLLDEFSDGVAGKGNEGNTQAITGYNPANRGLGAGLDVPDEDTDARQRNMWHKFWNSQPVCPKEIMNVMTDKSSAESILSQTIDEVPAEPAPLTTNGRAVVLFANFVWEELDLNDEAVLDEVFCLLRANYVEDDGNNFRFEYTKEFLRWALMVPGMRKDWHICLRAKDKGRMIAFISGVPITMMLHGKEVRCVEINFLCAKKGFREVGLAPIMITEITRRVRRTGVFHAVYTSGVELPGSFVKCQYLHRTLNFEKLYDVGFTGRRPNMTYEKNVKHLVVRREPCGLAPAREAGEGGELVSAIWRRPALGDAERILELLNCYFSRKSCGAIVEGSRYKSDGTLEFEPTIQAIQGRVDECESRKGEMMYYPKLSKEEIIHFLINPDESVVKCYVRERNGVVIDFVSYYILSSQILRPTNIRTGVDFDHEYTHINAAYSYLSAGQELSREELLHTALYYAKKDGHDVFNALIMGDQTLNLLLELKFGRGDGNLHHYAFNWKGPRLTEKDVGLILC